MAKNISKSVIEDIAYALKRVGLITLAYENENPTEEMLDNFGPIEEFDITGTDTVDWLIASIADVLSDHDPTFQQDRFIRQASFTVEI